MQSRGKRYDKARKKVVEKLTLPNADVTIQPTALTHSPSKYLARFQYVEDLGEAAGAVWGVARRLNGVHAVEGVRRERKVHEVALHTVAAPLQSFATHLSQTSSIDRYLQWDTPTGYCEVQHCESNRNHRRAAWREIQMECS